MHASFGMLLSGANGFLGCHLLWELQQKGVPRIKCLIRADGHLQARVRLEHALQAYQLELCFDTLEVIAVDLSKPDLGLSEQERGDLMVGVDCIVHAAACVNFTASVEQMIRTNVDATQALLRLAQAANVSRFVYISSLAVVNGLEWPARMPVPEAPLPLSQGKALSYYASTKMAAEQFCLAAASSALEMTVLRLPYLLAAASSLAINRHGYFDLILAAVLQLGGSFEETFDLHALPVDCCAAWVVRVALATAVPPVMHVLHNTPMPWSEWLNSARAMGLAITMEPDGSVVCPAAASCGPVASPGATGGHRFSEARCDT